MAKYKIAKQNQLPTSLTESRFMLIVHRFATDDIVALQEVPISQGEKDEFERVTFGLLSGKEVVFTPEPEPPF